MGDILFLADSVPFAAGRADESRGFHVLRHLSARKRVHLVAFADEPDDLKRKDALTRLTASRAVVWRSKPRLGARVRALATAKPLSLTAYDDAQMRGAVEKALSQRVIDTIYVLSSRMAHYVPARLRQHVVVDLVETETERYRAYAEASAWLPRIGLKREAHALFRHEQAIVRRADASLFASDTAAARFLGDGDDAIRIVENGVDTAHFDPAAPFRRIEAAGRLILFAGEATDRLDVEAAKWFADAVLPHVRARHPEARFAVVGRHPGAAATALGGRQDGVMVVADTDARPWLAAASVVVAPRMVMGGPRAGILEAMAMARPVVASAIAAAAIDHAGTIRIGATVGELADQIVWALANPSAAADLGKAARERVDWRYDWKTCLAAIDVPLQPRRAKWAEP
jgi:sugar transferase (PEP-CTERM/EpsH1 system associated)